MKKLLSVMLAITLVFGVFVSMPDAAEAADSLTVYVLTPDEDHGWTGSVAAYGQQGVDEINEAGKHEAVLQTASGAEEQIQQLEDIIANNKPGEYAVVMLPYDDTLEAAVTMLVNEEVPLVQFDRNIASVEDKTVANVKGDNVGTGAAAAFYCIEKGLTPGQAVWVLEGDSSSVNVSRNDGFVNFLLGEQDYNGEFIEEPWTEEEVNENILYSGVTGWSQATAQEMFENLMGDPENAKIKYIPAWDSGILMGVFDALAGSAIDEDTKEAFLENGPVMGGCSGLIYLYDLIAEESEYPEYVSTAEHCEGLMYTTYEPNMFLEAVRVMAQYLDGEEVEQDYVIATDIVEESNFEDFVPFD